MFFDPSGLKNAPPKLLIAITIIVILEVLYLIIFK